MYEKITSIENLKLAFQKARKGKTRRRYVKRFEKNLRKNILQLKQELENKTYQPRKLKKVIIKDPKTRKILKSSYRDRVVHHALCNIIVPDFEKSFIFDSHANQIGKGTHKAIERFDKFKRKVAKNNSRTCFIFKADIKHYFEEIDHNTLLNIIQRKINDKDVLLLIKKILAFEERERETREFQINNRYKRHASWKFNLSIFC